MVFFVRVAGHSEIERALDGNYYVALAPAIAAARRAQKADGRDYEVTNLCIASDGPECEMRAIATTIDLPPEPVAPLGGSDGAPY